MRRLVVIAVLVAAMVVVVGVARAGGPLDEALPSHPEVLRGQLSNGLSYAVRRHGVPAGGLTVSVSVRVGTLNEEDASRGSARVVERLAVARAAQLAKGSLEGAGVRIDRDLTSAVGFDRTQFSISVSNVDEAEAREVLKLLAGMVGGIEVDGAEMDKQRRLVAEQERAAASAALRLNTSLFPKIAPGSRIASRLPDATGAALWSLRPEGVEAFAKRWYVASAMSVVVVGDVDAGVMVGAVTEAFARLPAGGTRGFPEAGVGIGRGGPVIVESDGELTGDVVELVTLDHRAGAIRTLGMLRAQAVEDLAMKALATRLEESSENGDLAGSRMTALVSDVSTDVRAWLGLARGAPGTWDGQLAALVSEVRRAVSFGFTPGELELAQRTLLGAARAEAEQEATLDGAALAARYSDVVASGSTLMSGRQRAAALEAIFTRGISEEEVRAATMVRMDPARAAVLVLLPEAADHPGVERVTAILNEALAAPLTKVSTLAAANGPECLVDGAAAGGEIRELTTDSRFGIVTAALGNGAVAYHKKVTNTGGRVQIAVSLAGGLTDDDASLRGPTRAIEALWRSPAGGGRTGAQVRRILAGKDVRLTGQVLDNRVMLVVSAPSAEAETAMQLVHILLTRPVLERPAFDRWREQSSQMAEMRAVQAGPVAYEAMVESLLPPGERRTMLLSAAEAGAVEYDAASRRVAAVLTGAPFHAAITGDIELKSALSLVAAYLATASPRAPVMSAGSREGLCAESPCVAVALHREIATPNAEQAAVMAGFRGADSPSSEDGLALAVMAEVLSSRLNAELRDKRQLTPGVGVAARANETFRGSGQFWALAVCDPTRADELALAIDSTISELRGGVGDEEILAARARVREQMQRDLADAGKWAEELASMTRRGRGASDFGELPERIEALGAETIRERFRALSAPERRIRVIVVPSTQ